AGGGGIRARRRRPGPARALPRPARVGLPRLRGGARGLRRVAVARNDGRLACRGFRTTGEPPVVTSKPPGPEPARVSPRRAWLALQKDTHGKRARASMATLPLGGVLRRLRNLVGPSGPADSTDRQLLRRFAAGRDEDAFAALLGRHGPLVLGTCRRLLG